MQDTTTELNVTTTEMMDVDCEVSSWKAGGSCTVSCGGGVQQLYRDVRMPFDSYFCLEIEVEQAGNGEECPHLYETTSCSNYDCPGTVGFQLLQQGFRET